MAQSPFYEIFGCRIDLSQACELFESLTGWRVSMKGTSKLIYGNVE